jgi:hypothetical protein
MLFGDENAPWSGGGKGAAVKEDINIREVL